MSREGCSRDLVLARWVRVRSSSSYMVEPLWRERNKGRERETEGREGERDRREGGIKGGKD